MPGHHGTAVRDRRTDPFIGAIVLSLCVVASAVLSLAAGMTWQRLLHWAGELLLVLGVLLAAKGIRDVRREWTRLPGITKSADLKLEIVSDRAVSFLWLSWNRRVQKWPRLAERLHLRIHKTHKHSNDVVVLSGSASVKVEAPPPRVRITGGDTDHRFAQLEKRMAELEDEVSLLDAWRTKEIEARRAETAQERAERAVEDERIRKEMADLAGGGLRLQAWGVVCLLVGTILTAFF
jgi:hypothetical protein